MWSRNSLATGALAVVAVLALAGCPDPDGAYDDFVERYLVANPPIDAGPGCGHAPCDPPEAMGIEGQFFMTLSAVVTPNKPILLLADITTPAGADGVEIAFHLQALAVADKAPVGDPIDIGPYAVGPDGTFKGDMPNILIPGGANPISGSDVTTDAENVATICGHACKDEPDFLCGELTGKVKAGPLPVNLSKANGETSTFTFQRVTDAANLPAPLLDCDKTPPAL